LAGFANGIARQELIMGPDGITADVLLRLHAPLAQEALPS
jgi:hypothetical protein